MNPDRYHLTAALGHVGQIEDLPQAVIGELTAALGRIDDGHEPGWGHASDAVVTGNVCSGSDDRSRDLTDAEAADLAGFPAYAQLDDAARRKFAEDAWHEANQRRKAEVERQLAVADELQAEGADKLLAAADLRAHGFAIDDDASVSVAAAPEPAPELFLNRIRRFVPADEIVYLPIPRRQLMDDGDLDQAIPYSDLHALAVHAAMAPLPGAEQLRRRLPQPAQRPVTAQAADLARWVRRHALVNGDGDAFELASALLAQVDPQ